MSVEPLFFISHLDSDFETALRAQFALVHAFLAEKLPPKWGGIGALDGDELSAFVTEWRTTLYAAGYLAPGWPTE